MTEQRIITRPKDGYQFVLTGGHFSTAPVGGKPTKAAECEGCGTRTKPHAD